MATETDQWWRASALEWTKAAGVILGGLATAVAMVLAITNLMALL